MRDKKNVILTYAGAQLLEKAHSINALTRDIEIIAKKVATGTNGKLRIGYPFVPIIYQYRDIFAHFQENYPYVDMKYDSYSALKLSKELDKGNIDIAFTRYSFVHNYKNLVWHSLYTDPLCIVVGKKHPLHNQETAHIKDFEKDVLIISARIGIVIRSLCHKSFLLSSSNDCGITLQ